MKKKNIILFILILSISIGFAILSSNLGIGSNIAVADASFEVHFDNVEKIDSSIENDTYSFNQDNTMLNFTIPIDKPGDYVDYKFYVVNSGTIDASLNSLIVSIPQAAQDYITYTLTYYNGNTPINGDILKRGVNKPLKLHIEYKYDINNFISLENTTISVSLSYNQPQPIDKNIWNFDYEESEQTFKIPKTGTYKLEVWGAQGGTALYSTYNVIGGYGGYSTGEYSFTKDSLIYINVGGKGQNCTAFYKVLSLGGYNGGGNAMGGGADISCSGGGATHIAFSSGLLYALKNKVSDVIIVAGAGGGAGIHNSFAQNPGGHAGGYIGSRGNSYHASAGNADNIENHYGTGGTQSTGGKINDARRYSIADFGYGCSYKGLDRNTAGGAGYYGGGCGFSCAASGGGGSGYIGNNNLENKIMYCYNCKESTSEADETNIKTRSTTNVSETPKSNYAKIGNGYARITYIG